MLFSFFFFEVINLNILTKPENINHKQLLGKKKNTFSEYI